MTGKPSTYFIALILLVVFSMNSVVSFACSLGGLFHAMHHQQSSLAIAPGPHQHEQADKPHHSHEKKDQGDTESDTRPVKDNCCSDKASEIEKVDKSVSRIIEAPKLTFLPLFIAFFTSPFKVLPATESIEVDDLVRWRILTTIPDTRIVIQSFQI